MKKLQFFMLIWVLLLASCTSSQDQETTSETVGESSNLQIDAANREEGTSLNSF